jgi:regulator of sirC expression with transglutaminase-like and TPR domain
MDLPMRQPQCLLRASLRAGEAECDDYLEGRSACDTERRQEVALGPYELMQHTKLPLSLGLVLGFLFSAPLLGAEDDSKPAPPAAAKSVEQVAESARRSLAVITFEGRDGKRQGLGTGFVIAADGLIATNLHVLGEARPITVLLCDGKRYDVSSVHASDRVQDLALIRIPATHLTPLELGDSNRLKEGQAVVALGNPHGLPNSVVSGVVSAKREVEGKPMIQLAIPIEPGNSGGPLLDLQGRVHGILTMKSMLTPNLGFAVPINALKPLIQKPNPIPMSRWLTIGALDPAEWTVLFDARWKQRAGRITVEGAGTGFGGRSLCVARRAVPDAPYEVAVTVRLDDESGAAGLAFHSDGGDKHYGFYPSGGQLRLTRFEGPDVYSWTILHQKPSSHYRAGEWNRLKVRVEKDKILCFVNDHLEVESTDTGLTGGRVGLAKFRQTRAEFKQFQVGRQLRSPALPAEVVQRITKSVDELSTQGAPTGELLDSLVPHGAAGVTMLRDRAKQLEHQASQLRELADAVHQREVQAQLLTALQPKEDQIDLFHAVLLIAKLDNEELDIDAYRHELVRMASDIGKVIPKGADDQTKLTVLDKYLFSERGFHGSRGDYYNRANSYLNEVMDDREGLPITLSVLYLELARRLGVKVVGVGLPGHFVVKHVPAKGEGQLIDVFESGKRLSVVEAKARVRSMTGRPAREEDFAVVNKKAILIRIIHNLISIARGEKDPTAPLRYLDVLLAIAPDAITERLMRATVRYQAGDRKGALVDVDWVLQHHADKVETDRLQQFREVLTQPDR